MTYTILLSFSLTKNLQIPNLQSREWELNNLPTAGVIIVQFKLSWTYWFESWTIFIQEKHINQEKIITNHKTTSCLAFQTIFLQWNEPCRWIKKWIYNITQQKRMSIKNYQFTSAVHSSNSQFHWCLTSVSISIQSA